MSLTEHFSSKELKHLNKLPKTMKFMKWCSLGFSAFLIVMSIVNIRLALYVGHIFGIEGLSNVLSLWYGGVEIGKTYHYYELLIAQRVAQAHLCLGAAIYLLIFYYGNLKHNRILLKCWNLLSACDQKDRKA